VSKQPVPCIAATASAVLQVLEEKLILLLNQKGKIMKKIVSIVGIAAFAFGLTACNTMKGFGKDVERGGEKVQGAAQQQQQK
jgi:predicted small secreted protein